MVRTRTRPASGPAKRWRLLRCLAYLEGLGGGGGGGDLFAGVARGGDGGAFDDALAGVGDDHLIAVEAADDLDLVAEVLAKGHRLEVYGAFVVDRGDAVAVGVGDQGGAGDHQGRGIPRDRERGLD